MELARVASFVRSHVKAFTLAIAAASFLVGYLVFPQLLNNPNDIRVRNSTELTEDEMLNFRIQEAIRADSQMAIQNLFLDEGRHRIQSLFLNKLCEECFPGNLFELTVVSGAYQVFEQIAWMDTSNAVIAKSLDYAISVNDARIILLLLSKKADMLSKDELDDLSKKAWAYDLFYVAEELVKISVEKQLRSNVNDNSADINALTDNGWTQLMNAVFEDDIRTVSELLRNGADPNIVDEDGNGALFISAMFNSRTLALHLVENGSDIFAKNKYGLTAIDVAKYGKGVLTT